MRFGTFDAQQALGYLLSQVAHIEPQAYQIRYADILYPSLIPVDTSAPEWVKTVTYFSLDKVGKAQWINGAASDIPLAGNERTKFETTVELAGIGYGYNLEELNQAMLIPGQNLTADRAAAARRAYEEHVEIVAFSGDAAKGFQGLINNSSVTASSVPADGTGSSTTFASKTPDQILRDVNAALAAVYTTTLTMSLADTVLFPPTQLEYMARTPRSSTSDTTILGYLKINNIYTLTTGQQLTIRAVPRLAGAGAGATDRMITYRRDPQVMKLHLPMPHRFLPPWQNGPMSWVIPGIFRLGGLDVRLPKEVIYRDGI